MKHQHDSNVKFIHVRATKHEGPARELGKPVEKGGKTVAYEITGQEGDAVFVSYYVAVCPAKQHYTRHIAHQVCLGRLHPKRESTRVKHPVTGLIMHADDNVIEKVLVSAGLASELPKAVSQIDPVLAEVVEGQQASA